MLVPFFPIAVFLMGWCIVDILRQRIHNKYKTMLIVGVILLTIIGVLLYFLWVKPMIKKGLFAV